jgi:hypothetical protein
MVANWQQEHERWQRRDLSGRRFVYLWADGVYFTPRLDHDRQCLLVGIGAEADGNKELLAIEDGFRGSARRPRRSADLRGFANRIKGLLAFDGASCSCGWWIHSSTASPRCCDAPCSISTTRAVDYLVKAPPGGAGPVSFGDRIKGFLASDSLRHLPRRSRHHPGAPMAARCHGAGTRLVAALLLEQNDEWAIQRSRYMTLESIA